MDWGALCGATKLCANASERFVHRNAARRIGIMGLNPAIEFRLLRLREGQGLWGCARFRRNTVPDIPDESKALWDSQVAIVEGWIGHDEDCLENTLAGCSATLDIPCTISLQRGDEPIVVLVRADPRPDDGIADQRPKCSISKAYARRIDGL